MSVQADHPGEAGWADTTRLRHVNRNLLFKAGRFTSEGGHTDASLPTQVERLVAAATVQPAARSKLEDAMSVFGKRLRFNGENALGS
jgi:hypothetical protein